MDETSEYPVDAINSELNAVEEGCGVFPKRESVKNKEKREIGKISELYKKAEEITEDKSVSVTNQC